MNGWQMKMDSRFASTDNQDPRIFTAFRYFVPRSFHTTGCGGSYFHVLCVGITQVLTNNSHQTKGLRAETPVVPRVLRISKIQ
jgi:hypothetical protein